jgi:hypothetical protein
LLQLLEHDSLLLFMRCLPAQVRSALTLPAGKPMVQIVTGFLGKGVHTGAITTLGRGGSDLTATLIGAALDLAEVQVGGCVESSTFIRGLGHGSEGKLNAESATAGNPAGSIRGGFQIEGQLS